MQELTVAYTSSFKEGDKAEDTFKRIAESKGLEVADATKSQNMYDHIDFFITSGLGQKHSIDVKGAKRIQRSGEIYYSLHWVEFLNINGNRGWLYGKADFIAFEVINGFMMVRREHLIDYCCNRVSITDQQNPLEMPVGFKERYVPYRRIKYGKKDSLMLIDLNDLKKEVQFSLWKFS